MENISEISFQIDVDNYNSTRINSKIVTSLKNKSYKILNYNRDFICNDDKNSSLYRSVIVSSPENKLVCYSHPRSTDLEEFKKTHVLDSINYYVNEIVEGTMINLFFDNRIGEWEISTKGSVGGNYWYFRNTYEKSNSMQQKTFYEMFLDALCIEDLSDTGFLSLLPGDHSYSFVIQHPENHIVLPIDNPYAYLVGVYKIDQDTNTASMIPISDYMNWAAFKDTKIQLPYQYPLDGETFDSLYEKYCSPNNSMINLGIMITDIRTGERTSIENSVYANLKELRGNNPNLQYQYLCLKRANKIKEFLHYFPRYRKIFYTFYNQYTRFIKDVHNSYVSYYVKKSGVQVAKKFFVHAYKIHHNIFLPSLNNGEKKIITRDVVKEYVDNLDPGEILYYINYDMKNPEN